MLSLDELKLKFIVRFPGFKDIFNRVDVKIDDSLATACTDGYTLFFSSEYMSKLSEEQQLFVFAHELLHVALEHIARSEGKNHKNWNIATDAVINAYIKKCGIQSPDNLVDIADALNYSAETLYEKLQKEDEEKEKKKTDQTPDDNTKKGSGTDEVECPGGNGNNDEDKDKDKGNSSGNDNKDGDKEDGNSSSGNSNDKEEENPGFDDHSRWKDGLERMKKEQEEKENGEDSKGKDIDERDAFGKNDRVKDELDREIMGPNIGGSNESGNAPGGGSRRGNDGDNVRTEMIPWQRLLKESLHIDYDYDTSIGEEEDGVIVTPFEPYPKPKTEIIIDSSYSISDDLIKNFLSECLSIIQNSETDVGFFGTSFSGFQRVRTKQDIDDLEIYNGGGTDFNIAVNSFTNRADNKIIFTDGMDSDPKKYCDAIWVVVGEIKHEIHPPGGKVIYITGEDYRRLCESRKSKTR